VRAQGTHRLLWIGSVLNDANTKNNVKLPWPDWESENIRLADKIVRVATAVGIIRFHCFRKVNCEDIGASGKQEFSETSGSAARLQDLFAFEGFQWCSQQTFESIL